jgi:hypothetical protein
MSRGIGRDEIILPKCAQTQELLIKHEKMAGSAHDFEILMNDGSTRSMSHYKGSPVLIVNVASV